MHAPAYDSLLVNVAAPQGLQIDKQTRYVHGTLAFISLLQLVSMHAAHASGFTAAKSHIKDCLTQKAPCQQRCWHCSAYLHPLFAG